MNGDQTLILIGSLEYGMKPLNVGLRITVNKKIDNLKDMEIWADISLLSATILKQYNKKKTSNLEALADAIARLTFYFQENINNKRLYKKAISDYRLARNRAVERARKAEKENEEIKLKLKKYANI